MAGAVNVSGTPARRSSLAGAHLFNNTEVSDRRPPAANPETKVNRGGGSLD